MRGRPKLLIFLCYLAKECVSVIHEPRRLNTIEKVMARNDMYGLKKDIGDVEDPYVINIRIELDLAPAAEDLIWLFQEKIVRRCEDYYYLFIKISIFLYLFVEVAIWKQSGSIECVL